ncbi:MAG: pantoate--beta-alanine ligase [Bacteroidales bacterium]|nr:pantoate--beta-alanine ligase [Bacteroidales bacterium]
MLICKTISEAKQILTTEQKNRTTIGFVPTMGALHEGHLALIRKARSDCNFVVVSIFVNPTQFNNREDFEKYPRIFESDIEKLRQSGSCDLLFMPNEEEMYPEPDTRYFELGYLEQIMEGKYRPGHFQGVVKIVTKLFDIINPHKAYFGKKDFQQLTIIKKIVRDFNYPIEIVECDIVRETNGLAMSSRNLRLSEDERNKASIIFKTLIQVKKWIDEKYSINEICQKVKTNIESVSPFQVEYVEVVDSQTLMPVNDISQHRSIHCCVAVFCNQVRLIDNIEILL